MPQEKEKENSHSMLLCLYPLRVQLTTEQSNSSIKINLIELGGRCAETEEFMQVQERHECMHVFEVEHILNCQC